MDRQIESIVKDYPQTRFEPEEKAKVKIERWFEPSELDTTLELSNGYELYLKHTDSIWIEEYFIDQATLDSISTYHDNSHLRSISIENFLLNKYSNYAKRDSSGLHLKLKNGQWFLVPIDIKSDETDNTFEFYFKDLGFYSVRTQWGEGNGYKLIHDSTEKITNLYGRPYFSPDGNFVISVNADIEAGYSSNGFQLFKNENGILELIATFDASAWGPFSAKWTDNFKVIIKNQTVEFTNGNMDYLDFYSELNIKKIAKRQ